jgi:hypothetical protein
MADSYISATNYDELLVPVKAATVYAAHERSLFLGGALIPSVAAPNGLLKIGGLATATAYSVANGDLTTDVTISNPTEFGGTIVCDLIAARSVVRDLGAIDPAEIGRSLGNAVSAEFDKRVVSEMGNLTSQTAAGDLNLDEVFAAVGTIRAAGETGRLFGIVGADQYATIMSAIGNAAYAGGDFQTEALRSGFLGNIAGVTCFVSSYFNATNTGVTGAKMAVFGEDAMRIAMQKNVDLEVGRRAEAVGFDVVASLHANVGLVDAARGVIIA